MVIQIIEVDATLQIYIRIDKVISFIITVVEDNPRDRTELEIDHNQANIIVTMFKTKVMSSVSTGSAVQSNGVHLACQV